MQSELLVHKREKAEKARLWVGDGSAVLFVYTVYYIYSIMYVCVFACGNHWYFRVYIFGTPVWFTEMYELRELEYNWENVFAITSLPLILIENL